MLLLSWELTVWVHVVVCTPAIQGVDLDVSMQKVALVVPEQYQLDLQLPCAVVHGESRAKFSARKSKLTLTIPKSVTA